MQQSWSYETESGMYTKRVMESTLGSLCAIDDIFHCPSCISRNCRAKSCQKPDSLTRHTYIHPVVRYQGPQVSDDVENPPLDGDSAESTLVSLMKGLPPLIKECTPEQLASVQQALAGLKAIIREVKKGRR